MTTAGSTPTVRPAGADDRDACIAVMVTAFAADPLIRWMLPGPRQYVTWGPSVVGHYGGRAFEHGTAYLSADGAGAAMWLPPGVGPDEELLGATMAEAVDEASHEAVFGLLEQVDAAHPAEPHWFLPAIGVDPPAQGRGLGAALMAPMLARCDEEGAIAYLESSNLRNLPFYERLGFEAVARIQAGDSPVVTAMVRAPL